MSLCPESEYRRKLSDKEFWAHVFQTDDEYYTDFDVLDSDFTDQSCNICGSNAACGYDIEGRPMIHSTENDEYE